MKAQLSLFTPAVSTSSLFSPLDAFVSHLAESIADGRGDATLIPWEHHDAAAAIEAAEAVLIALGWVWNKADKQLERDGWFVWFRSQGVLSSPIAQWARLDAVDSRRVAEAARRRASVALCACGHQEREHFCTDERGCHWSAGNGPHYQDCACDGFRLASDATLTLF